MSVEELGLNVADMVVIDTVEVINVRIRNNLFLKSLNGIVVMYFSTLIVFPYIGFAVCYTI